MNGFIRKLAVAALFGFAMANVAEARQAPAPQESPAPEIPDGTSAPEPGFTFTQSGDGPSPAAPRAPRPGQQPGPPQGPPPQGPPPQGGTPAPRAEQPPDVFVENTGFKNKVLDVKHRDPGSLIPVLRGLASGFRGARLDPSRDFRTLTVRDFPENIAAIEEAIRRLDTPMPIRPDVELKLHVLFATSNATAPGTDVPDEIKPVVVQLQSTFNLKRFSVLTSVVQRVRDGSERIGGSGILMEQPGEPRSRSEYGFQARSVIVNDGDGGSQRINIDEFFFRISGNMGNGNLNTSLSLRPGEKVVVGTANIGGGALVLVLTANLVK